MATERNARAAGRRSGTHTGLLRATSSRLDAFRLSAYEPAALVYSRRAVRAPFSRSPLLPYAEELEPLQRRALRTACLLAAFCIVAFSALDRALLPAAWLGLLGLRVAAGVLLLGIERWLRSERARFAPGVALVVFVLAATLSAGTLATGGVHSSYPYSALLIVLGTSILLPLRPAQAAWIHLEMIRITLLPLFPLAAARDDKLALAAR